MLAQRDWRVAGEKFWLGSDILVEWILRKVFKHGISQKKYWFGPEIVAKGLMRCRVFTWSRTPNLYTTNIPPFNS